MTNDVYIFIVALIYYFCVFKIVINYSFSCLDHTHYIAFGALHFETFIFVQAIFVIISDDVFVLNVVFGQGCADFIDIMIILCYRNSLCIGIGNCITFVMILLYIFIFVYILSIVVMLQPILFAICCRFSFPYFYFMC